MDEQSIPLKQCSRKEKCVNQLGCWLPATPEFFYRRAKCPDGLGRYCKQCDNAASEKARSKKPEKYQAQREKYRAEHREEMKAYLKDYYRDHPEIFAEYREEHAEEIASYKRKYRQEHPEETKRHKSESQKRNRASANARGRRHHQRHPEKQREASRLRRLINPEAERERNRRYKQEHPEARRAEVHRRRARLRGSVGNHTPADIELQRKAQTDKRGRLHCWWCGKVIKDGKYHVDHKMPLSRGGSNAPENLCISCPYCNDSKGAKLLGDWNGRLL